MTADRALCLLLRLDALVVLCAAPCALLPVPWMDFVHDRWLGLGPFPDSPIARYMARSLSLVYALHGATVLAVTLNWDRYRPLAPVLAWLHIVFGLGMLAVDLDARVPWYWAATEGPGIATYGAVLLLLYRRANRAR
ncbi:MAG: hypothetical protein FJ304_19065 [Planctomycetes bacterium]|nr:hypothetical protein [Planctomycetota bacterium]